MFIQRMGSIIFILTSIIFILSLALSNKVIVCIFSTFFFFPELSCKENALATELIISLSFVTKITAVISDDRHKRHNIFYQAII